MFVASRVDYRILRRLSPLALGTGVLLLAGLFVFGHTIRDTVRWYSVSALQMTLQPAELTRLALVLFLAFWLARKGKDIEEFKTGFAPAAMP